MYEKPMDTGIEPCWLSNMDFISSRLFWLSSQSTFQPANIRGTLLMPPQDTIHCWQVSYIGPFPMKGSRDLCKLGFFPLGSASAMQPLKEVKNALLITMIKFHTVSLLIRCFKLCKRNSITVLPRNLYRSSIRLSET